MPKPAFRTTYYQNYPEPFYPGASGRYPVPGWGVRPVMAGPSRVGVGAVAASGGRTMAPMIARAPMVATSMASRDSAAAGGKPFPWVWVFTAAGLLGGGVALAFNFGLVGRKRR